MSIISWNCRGLGNHRAVRVLGELLKTHKPDFLFLSETLSCSNRIKELSLKFGFSRYFAVDKRGRAGGLAIFWKHTMVCEVIDSSQNHIDVIISETNLMKWRLTCYYGFPERERRRQAWDFLRLLSSNSNLPWCVLGDFNDLLCGKDKKGKHLHPQNLLDGFKAAIEDCGLNEVDLTGGLYTWEKSKGTKEWVRERLDRAFASNTWWSLFPLCTLSVFHIVTSDHEPIKLSLFNTMITRKQFRFKFENIWLKEESFSSEISSFWQNLPPTHMLPKLISVSAFMAKWGKVFFNKFREKVVKQKSIIDTLKNREDAEGVRSYFAEKSKLEELLFQEESYWKQRAKTLWLEEGDANTRFFHAAASSRKKTNHITSLKSEDGRVLTKHEDLCGILKDYYTNVFAASDQVPNNPEGSNDIQVTAEQNRELTKEISYEEFTAAIKSMHPDKASGPDGLNPAFFQHFWNLLGREVFNCCKGWLDVGKFSANVNDTNLVLIPKKENVEEAKDLRPIALCNVLYKIVAKVLSNRLQKILPVLISEEQSAFVPGRNITNNVLVAFELIHFMKRKTGGDGGNVALKLDISKAYDRVSWDYLRNRMVAMGFSYKWIQWMMLCVTSVSYSICFQGSNIGPIIPKRGLRQGDPLSPYLFLLCVEGLSLSLKDAANRTTVSGCRICPQAPAITHLLFADDSFLFFKADADEANAIKEVLNRYETLSGQAVNYQKSAIFFSSNVRRDKQTEIKNILQVQRDLGSSKYLGLPSLIGKSKKTVFSYLKDKVWEKVNNWNTKLLSRAGKAVLLRNVAQTIPAYTMSCFLLPKSLCQEIERIMNAFWWNSNSSNSKGIKWLSWSRMSTSKKKGGLGFRDLYGFNLALLGKQCWNLLKNPEALLSRLLKAKYYPNCSLLQAGRTGGSSFTWSGIWEAKENLKNGIRWVLGDGNSIHIFTDRWLRGKSSYCVDRDVDDSTVRTEKTSDYFTTGTRTWDETKVRSDFNNSDAETILAVRIPQNSTIDRLAWVHSNDGQYSVRSGYHYWHSLHATPEEGQSASGWGKIWRLCIPHKMKVLLWRICRNTVPVRHRLRGKGVRVPITCMMCSRDIEHLLHLFCDCEFTRACWQHMGLIYDTRQVESAPEWLLETLSSDSNENLIKVATVVWGVWWARNKRVWEGKIMTPKLAMEWSSKQVFDWSEAQKKKVQKTSHRQEERRQHDLNWTAPVEGLWKLNVDASVFEGSGSFSIGMAIRDHRGNFLQGRTMRFAGEVNVVEAELVRILEALKWTDEFHGQGFIVESDSLLSVQAVKGSRQNFLEAGVLIEHCRTILGSKTNVSLSFVKKHANRVAHLMARIPCTLNSFVGFSSPPLSVLETLVSEI